MTLFLISTSTLLEENGSNTQCAASINLFNGTQSRLKNHLINELISFRLSVVKKLFKITDTQSIL